MLTAEQNDEATTRKAAQAVETKATTCKCSISKQFKQYKLKNIDIKLLFKFYL